LHCSIMRLHVAASAWLRECLRGMPFPHPLLASPTLTGLLLSTSRTHVHDACRRAQRNALVANDPTVQVYLYHFSFVFDSLFSWPFTTMGAFHGSELV
jgi:hypothetical protein